MSVPTLDHSILKGKPFTDRVAAICRRIPPTYPLHDLKHRRVLVSGMVGGEVQFAMLGLLSHALRIRGAETLGLVCDRLLPACTMKKVDHHESACDRWCHKNIAAFMEAAHLPFCWHSGFLRPGEREDCERAVANLSAEDILSLEFHGIPLGRHVARSVESYFKVGRFDLDNTTMRKMARPFAVSAMLMTLVSERALEELRIDKVLMDDGGKVEWGITREVAYRRGVPVDICQGAPRGMCYLAMHAPSPETTDPVPNWSRWRDVPLTPAQDNELDRYMQQRATRPYEDQVWSPTEPIDDRAKVRAMIGLPPNVTGQVFAMFPNLGYEAGVTAFHPAYPTGADWVADSIALFREWPAHHLIVKIHPSELARLALDSTMTFPRQAFDRLPSNVHVLPPETPLTAQDVIRAADVALVYTSTVGIEAAVLGRPVINVGGGWHCERGFSTDIRTPVQYREQVQQICADTERLPSQTELARRYAYTLFFRCALPIRHYTQIWPNVTALTLNSLSELSPGRDRTMDVLCRGILLDEPFEIAD